MHPIDDLGHPLSVVLVALLILWVGWAFLRAWQDERRERQELDQAYRQMEALNALRRMQR